MSSEWEIVEVGDVCSVGDGAHSKVARQTNGVPYLTSKNIGQGQLKPQSLDYISLDDFERLFPFKSKATRRPQSGDILIGIIGTFGNSYVYKESDHFGFSSSIGLLRPDNSKLDSLFLYYVITSTKFRVVHENFNAGSVQGYTNIATVKKLKVPLPPLSAQKKIALILAALDDRITLLRETNATLEAIAQALFKSWFVDFDPVHAKQQGLAPEGMDEATAALFPDSFEESELGLVPRGWLAGTLGDIATTVRKQLQPSELHSELHYVGLEHIPRKSLSLSAWDSADGLESAKAVFSKGDILFGKLRPYFHKVVIAPFDGICSTDILVCQSKKSAYYGIGAMHLSSTPLIAYAERLSNGAKMPRVNWKDLAEYPVCVPSEALAVNFSETITPLISRMTANVHQARTLATMRDTLLPRLISGRLRLLEIETALEGVAA